MRDLIVVGGGPAGLAVAAEAARRGLDALVLERRSLPADKACGEGILPGGLRASRRWARSATSTRVASRPCGPSDGCRRTAPRRRPGYPPRVAWA